MKAGLRHKIFFLFATLVAMVLLIGLGIGSSVKHISESVETIGQLAVEVRTAMEVANGVNEEELLLLVAASGRNNTDTLERFGKVHFYLMSLLDSQEMRHQFPELRGIYDEYWNAVQEGLAASGGPDGVFPESHRRAVDAMTSEISARLKRLIDEKLSMMGKMQQRHGGLAGLFHSLVPTASYGRSTEEFVMVFRHILEYDEMWASVIDVQIDAFRLGKHGERDRRANLEDGLENLVQWINSRFDPVSGAGDLVFFREDELSILGELGNWAEGYIPRIDGCLARNSDDYRACYMAQYKNSVDIYRHLVRHGAMETKHVTSNIMRARESVLSLTRTFTTVVMIFSIMAFFIALYIWRTIVKPVELLRSGFEGIGSGDFSIRLPVLRNDELGQLQEGFNKMAGAVEKRDADIKSATMEIENLAFRIQNYNEDLEQEVAKRTRELNKAYENIKENDRLKSEFIANMSHELRTPLNSIIGFSKVILKGIDGPVTEKQREDLTLIHQSGTHLLNLISQILDFSKIEAGGIELRKERVHIESIVGEAIASVNSLIKDKTVAVETELAGEIKWIWADRMRLLQIIINLLSNSAKFTERGFIRLETMAWTPEHSARPAKMPGFSKGVLFVVSDTGIGIPEKAKHRVFDRFQQVDGSSTRAYGGTGLGLAITKELVLLHGGLIWFESTMGKGSTFYVLLPSGGNESGGHAVHASRSNRRSK
ncbi:MAG: HAMP domain-containing protein [Nitrospirae bacterium]|nr:HAMP domain-containing protein [Nitrospirota bacterium]